MQTLAGMGGIGFIQVPLLHHAIPCTEAYKFGNRDMLGYSEGYLLLILYTHTLPV